LELASHEDDGVRKEKERLTLDKEWMSRLSRRIYDGNAIILGDDVGTGEQDLIFIFSSPPTSYLLPGCNLHDSTD